MSPLGGGVELFIFSVAAAPWLHVPGGASAFAVVINPPNSPLGKGNN